MSVENEMVRRLAAALIPVYRRAAERLIKLIPEMTMIVQNTGEETPEDGKPEAGHLGPSPIRSQYAEWYNCQRSRADGSESQRAYNPQGEEPPALPPNMEPGENCDEAFWNRLRERIGYQPAPPGGWDVPKCGLGPMDNRPGYLPFRPLWFRFEGDIVFESGQIINAAGRLWEAQSVVINNPNFDPDLPPNQFHFGEVRPTGDYSDSTLDVDVILSMIVAVINTGREQ